MSSSTSSSSVAGAVLDNALDTSPVAAWAHHGYWRRALFWPIGAYLAAELICRIVSPIYLVNPDPAAIEVVAPGYRALRPNYAAQVNVGGKPIAVRIHNEGFRDEPFPAAAPCLIVGVGNSYVANWAIDRADFWSTKLELMLRQNPQAKRCAVRSAGFQGWGLGEIDAALAHRILPKNPAIVVLFFNNLTMWTPKTHDAHASDADLARWLKAPPAEPQAVPQAPPSPMARAIGLYNQIESHSALLGSLKVYVPMLPMTLGLSQLGVPVIYRDEVFAERQAPTLATLDSLRQRVAAGGAQLVVVVLPSIAETDEGVYDLMLATVGGSDRGVDALRPAATVRAWAERRGVPVLDLGPALRAHWPAAMSKVDHHWNEVGNELAAEKLVPVVNKLL